MTTKTKMTASEKELILPAFIQPVTGRRERPAGRIKIPTYDELPKVKGKFKNIEAPGTGIAFTCRFWKGPPMTFRFFDGCEYTIPAVLADHLNESCAYKQLRWISPDGVISTGKPIVQGGSGFQGVGQDFTKEVKNKDYRFMFQITGNG